MAISTLYNTIDPHNTQYGTNATLTRTVEIKSRKGELDRVYCVLKYSQLSLPVIITYCPLRRRRPYPPL